MSQSAVLVIGETDADAERLDLLARYLREELAALDGLAVDDVTIGEAPVGARGIDVAAAGALVLALGKSEVLRGVIDTVRRWLDRSPQTGRTIRLQLDGDVLELSNASSSAESELVTMFVSRHS